MDMYRLDEMQTKLAASVDRTLGRSERQANPDTSITTTKSARVFRRTDAPTAVVPTTSDKGPVVVRRRNIAVIPTAAPAEPIVQQPPVLPPVEIAPIAAIEEPQPVKPVVMEQQPTVPQTSAPSTRKELSEIVPLIVRVKECIRSSEELEMSIWPEELSVFTFFVKLAEKAVAQNGNSTQAELDELKALVEKAKTMKPKEEPRSSVRPSSTPPPHPEPPKPKVEPSLKFRPSSTEGQDYSWRPAKPRRQPQSFAEQQGARIVRLKQRAEALHPLAVEISPPAERLGLNPRLLTHQAALERVIAEVKDLTTLTVLEKHVKALETVSDSIKRNPHKYVNLTN